jgi:hypothetical protein
VSRKVGQSSGLFFGRFRCTGKGKFQRLVGLEIGIIWGNTEESERERERMSFFLVLFNRKE